MKTAKKLNRQATRLAAKQATRVTTTSVSSSNSSTGSSGATSSSKGGATSSKPAKPIASRRPPRPRRSQRPSRLPRLPPRQRPSSRHLLRSPTPSPADDPHDKGARSDPADRAPLSCEHDPVSTMGLDGVLPWQQARQVASTAGRPLPGVHARLDEAGGSVLDRDLVTVQDDPSADSAAVSGFAVCGEGPWLVDDLDVLTPGSAVPIDERMPIPRHADAVIAVSNVSVPGAPRRTPRGHAARPTDRHSGRAGPPGPG